MTAVSTVVVLYHRLVVTGTKAHIWKGATVVDKYMTQTGTSSVRGSKTRATQSDTHRVAPVCLVDVWWACMSFG